VTGNPMRNPKAVIALLLTLLGFTAGCVVGPRYERPAATAPTTAPSSAWKTSRPGNRRAQGCDSQRHVVAGLP